MGLNFEPKKKTFLFFNNTPLVASLFCSQAVMVKIFFSLLVFIQWFGTQLLEKLIRFSVFFF